MEFWRATKGQKPHPPKLAWLTKGGVILDQEVPKVDDGRLPLIVCSYCASNKSEVSRSSVVASRVFTASMVLLNF